MMPKYRIERLFIIVHFFQKSSKFTLSSIHNMWDLIWAIMLDPWGVPGSTKTYKN